MSQPPPDGEDGADVGLVSSQAPPPSMPSVSLPSAPSSSSDPPPPPAEKDTKSAKKAPPRKRTKTGCATCRQRRIKCDEGKPTCNNCLKSKRDCLGYSQRLTFKEPLSTYPHASYNYSHGPGAYQQRQLHQQQQQQQQQRQRQQQQQQQQQHQNQQQQAQAAMVARLAAQGQAMGSQGSLPTIAPRPPVLEAPALPGPMYGQPVASMLTGQMGFDQAPYAPQEHQLPSPPFLAAPSASHAAVEAPPAQGNPWDFWPSVDANAQIHPSADHAAFTPGHPQQLPLMSNMPGHQVLGSAAGGDDIMHHARPGMGAGPVYWHSDDEASLVESEDGAALSPARLAHVQNNSLGPQVARQLAANHLQIAGTLAVDPEYDARFEQRVFEDDPRVLDTYYPSSADTPLNQPQTAAVFNFYVHTTGPSLSLYEPNTHGPAPVYHDQPVPRARHHPWTYTSAVLSLNHPALLQAILALASLQMAMLRDTHPSAALKHYHLSLRRCAKNYRSDLRRPQPATLAATLLLGFYEVWASDHENWCRHIWGSQAIIKEMRLVEMTRDIRAIRLQKRQFLLDMQARQLTGHRPEFDDEDDGHGPVPSLPRRQYTERDIEEYDYVSSLFWWYARNDLYQSVLGGNKLYLDYKYWPQVLPRAPFGRVDAVNGTYDHLLLLLGRVANFTSLDMSRKREASKAEAAAAGQGPQTGPGPSPGQGPGPTQTAPMFAGMMPWSQRFSVPTGFDPPRDPRPGESRETGRHGGTSARTANKTNHIHLLGERTAAALAEWEAIRRAFDVFTAALPPEFAPLGPEHIGSTTQGTMPMSPFGPVRIYRLLPIAGVWMLYHVGLILLHRAHPSMPPVAMMAAGAAAASTAAWANEIGRIAAGTHPEGDLGAVAAVSTMTAAALHESAFCLFVAGVQYRDLAQRHWLIRRLHDICRLTGWQSARTIARGCEVAWTRAAHLGRGPPYEPPEDVVTGEREQKGRARGGGLGGVWISDWRPRRANLDMRAPPRGETGLGDLGEMPAGEGSGQAREGDGGEAAEAQKPGNKKAHFAVGLVGLEGEVERLNMDEREEEELARNAVGHSD